MAKEYIEREVLLDDIDKTVLFDVRTKIRNLEIRGANKVINRIKAQPTADVKEVRHGRWIKSKNERKCSLCGYFYFTNTKGLNFCPHCGAKMDKES